MDFGGDFVIESNVIAEFVADLFPKAQLRPEGHFADAALKAAKMRLFVEVWQSKVQSSIFTELRQTTLHSQSNERPSDERTLYPPFVELDVSRLYYFGNYPPILLGRSLHVFGHVQ